MSTIAVSASASSAYSQAGDLTGNLVITTVGGLINSAVNTGSIAIPSGNTAQRPSGVNGMVRYNTSTNALEGYANNTWVAFL
jgi:hypothetical protein